MYKESDFKKKKIQIDQLIDLIKPGNRIFISSGAGIPAHSVGNLIKSNKLAGYDLEFVQLFTLGEYFESDECELTNYRLVTFRTGESIGKEHCMGKVDYIPANIMEIPNIFYAGAINLDIAIITTSPPDKHGFMSLGIAVDVAAIAIKKAQIVVAEVNPNMPVTYGETSVHVNQVNYVIESSEPLPERSVKFYGPELERIGWHISNLIQDGANIVLHVGSLFDSVAHHIKTKKNLGIFTNVISDWIIDLIESGAISTESISTGRGNGISTSYCYGTRRLYDYIDKNQLFGFYPISRFADPFSIKNISNLISIMNVDKIDISGSNIVFRSGDDLLSGFESKFNFAVGAAFSGNGKVIFALRSTDMSGESNIVISHDKDTERQRSTLGVTRYVVTEYGVANLFGKSIRERTLALIEIAHPSHRENLFNTAKERGYLFPDQIYAGEHIANYPSEIETIKSFKEGVELRIRPVRPSDADMMRRLFYKFSDESRYLRYFTNIKIMPHKNMQKYVNIDYDKTFSVVAVQQRGSSEKIVAEARYAQNPDSNSYEMAFLVDDEFHGKGIGTFMVNYIIEIARSKKIKKLTASVLFQNQKMLEIFKKANVTPKIKAGSDDYEIEFTL